MFLGHTVVNVDRPQDYVEEDRPHDIDVPKLQDDVNVDRPQEDVDVEVCTRNSRCYFCSQGKDMQRNHGKFKAPRTLLGWYYIYLHKYKQVAKMTSHNKGLRT